MAKITIRDRQGKMVRYVVYDDDGHFLKSAHRDVSEEIAEAKRRKVSLVKVLAERERVKLAGPPPDAQEIPVLADAPVAADHTHEEFRQPVQEHDHSHRHDLPGHEHDLPPHKHEHSHPLIPHAHDLEEHGHGLLGTRLELIERGLETALNRDLTDHEHEHSHPHKHEEEYQTLALGLVDLRRELAELRQLAEARPPVPDHEHPLVIHRHEAVDHSHPLMAHQHDVSAHSHEAVLPEHNHDVPPHEHPLSDHSHPEIVGLFSPEKLREGAKKLEGHLHHFDTMRDDGLGWVCGDCGLAKEGVING